MYEVTPSLQKNYSNPSVSAAFRPGSLLTETRWQPLITSTLRDRALESISTIAERLRNPKLVLSSVEMLKKQAKFACYWHDTALFSGFSGSALLYSYLASSFPDQQWVEAVHVYLQIAAQGSKQDPFTTSSLSVGSSGLAFALSTCCKSEPRYQKTCDALNTHIAAQVLEVPWQRDIPGVSMNDYDIIGGAAGTLSYLISIISPSPLVEDAIQKLLTYLIWLGGKNEEGRENWFIPPKLLPMEHYHRIYPNGYFNLGLAHGIPGPLAALSLAWLSGYSISGQREAMIHMSRWIVEHQVQDGYGINWPEGVSLQASLAPERWGQLYPARAAWCYGAPGVASALWLAGDALENETLHNVALETIEAVLRRPPEVRGISSPTLCHGIGGLLTICLRFAHRIQSSLLREHIPILVEQILEACSPDFPLGVRDEEVSGNFVDNPTFLTGAAGVALVLLAATTSVEPAWDRAFLIA